MQTIKIDEGFRSEMYTCPAGKKTIGYGFNLEAQNVPQEVATLWSKSCLNLANPRIEAWLADVWLRILISNIQTHLYCHLDCFTDIGPIRQKALINMAYQLGLGGLMGFKHFLARLDGGYYTLAAAEALNSKWAKHDSPERARRVTEVIRTGTLDSYDGLEVNSK